MERVRIYRLTGLRSRYQARLRAAQMEAARVWMLCRDAHLAARQDRTRWPKREDLQRATKGQFALQSQTVQMICHAFLANIETPRELRKTNPRIRYPYKDKRYYPLYWPAQAVSRERGRVVLPMGRGRQSLVFQVNLPAGSGACKLVWNDGYELHVAVPAPMAEAAPGQAHATVDLGEIHQAAVTTNTGAALVISGRGIRSLKRRHNMALGQLTRKRKRCQKGSRRYRKLQAARRRVSARKRRQIRDLRHKGTRAVMTFCQQQALAPFSSAIRTGSGTRTADATTTSAWPNGSTARIWPISPISPNKPTSRASPALSGARRAGVRYAGGNRKSRGASGAAETVSVPLWDTATWWAA